MLYQEIQERFDKAQMDLFADAKSTQSQSGFALDEGKKPLVPKMLHKIKQLCHRVHLCFDTAGKTFVFH